MLDLIARMSSRLFLGPELCRDETWLSVTKSFAIKSFQASDSLRRYPMWMRGFAANWLLPECKLVREQAVEAEILVANVIKARRERRAQAKTKHEETDDDDDTQEENSVDWFEEEADGRQYNAGKTQLLLSAVAIQTTSDLLTEVMLQLAQRPDFVQELREEIARVLKSAGAWSKPALFNMKLLDSAIKEAQRIRPVLFGMLLRLTGFPERVYDQKLTGSV